MNERIREIEDQAWEQVNRTNGLVRTEDFHKKFAELIVRECIDITSGLSKLFPRTDVAFDVGYTTGTTRATKEIKKYFGVE
jgi:hypothetical protein